MEATKREETLDRIKENLLSGKAFSLGALSERSVRGYQPPANREYWGNAIAVIVQMACQNDTLAQVAWPLIRGINLYQTNHEIRAKVFENAAHAIAQGYDDVIRRSGPEPIRYSDAQRPYTAECIQLDYWLNKAIPCLSSVGGVGWAVAQLAEDNRVFIPALLTK